MAACVKLPCACASRTRLLSCAGWSCIGVVKFLNVLFLYKRLVENSREKNKSWRVDAWRRRAGLAGKGDVRLPPMDPQPSVVAHPPSPNLTTEGPPPHVHAVPSSSYQSCPQFRVVPPATAPQIGSKRPLYHTPPAGGAVPSSGLSSVHPPTLGSSAYHHSAASLMTMVLKGLPSNDNDHPANHSGNRAATTTSRQHLVWKRRFSTAAAKPNCRGPG